MPELWIGFEVMKAVFGITTKSSGRQKAGAADFGR
jgi:hypothetical protein